MAAIYKREMHSYLTSAVGYVFLAVFFAISGYYFFATSLVSNSTDLSYVFSNLFSIAIFLVPLLTMKLFSEERKQRTEQLLFTAPVRFTGVVLGKFFASLTMYLLGMSVTLVYFLVMCAFRGPRCGGIRRKLSGTAAAGSGAVCHRHLYFCFDREPGDCGSGFACHRDVFAVCQQLYTGGVQPAAQQGDGRHLLL